MQPICVTLDLDVRIFLQGSGRKSSSGMAPTPS